MFITHSAVLCYESALHIMGMLLGFDSYTKCVLILYKLFLQCFYKNMHLPIVLCCDIKIHCLYTINTTIGCDCIPYTKHDACQCSLF